MVNKTQKGKGFIKTFNKFTGLNSQTLNDLDDKMMAMDRKLKKLSILTKLNKFGALQPVKHALSALPLVGKPISLGVDLALQRGYRKRTTRK